MDKHNITGQIHNSMHQNIKKKGYVAPVDVLMDIGVLSKKDYEDWRFGKVDYLERVCRTNLRMLSDIMKKVRAYATKNQLKPSWTCYHQWGKNKDRRLRFSKSKDEKIEKHYATHFIDTDMVKRLKNMSESQPEEYYREF
jgi:hypothetical protein